MSDEEEHQELHDKSKSELSEEVLVLEKKISRFRDEKKSKELLKELYDMLEKRKSVLKEKLNEEKG